MRQIQQSQLTDGYHAVVLGASGALGSAFCERLLACPRLGQLTPISRQTHPDFSLESEASIAAAQASLPGPIHLLIDATGALTIDGQGPEKRLDQLDPDRLMRAFMVNAIGRALVLKHFLPAMARAQRVVVGCLSARVGSIEDNRLGGWYGYRASKAAGNMLLQTAAIELSRTRPQAVLAALQPGTVRSRLSAPFTGPSTPEHPVLEPLESADRLLAVLDGLQPTGRAAFKDHLGADLPW